MENNDFYQLGVSLLEKLIAQIHTFSESTSEEGCCELVDSLDLLTHYFVLAEEESLLSLTDIKPMSYSLLLSRLLKKSLTTNNLELTRSLILLQLKR